MNERRKIAWILGWAIPITSFEGLVRHVFPNDDHLFFEARPDVASAITLAAPFDYSVGYSLGSLLLLKSNLPLGLTGKKVLLSPILGFSREMNLGGKISDAHLRYTQRLLDLDPVRTVNAFYETSGLVSLPRRQEPYTQDSLELLKFGLNFLGKERHDEKINKDILCLCGALDTLLDAETLKTSIPELRVIDQATHDPLLLIQALEAVIK